MRAILLIAALTVASLVIPAARADEEATWAIPSNEEIRQVLATRMEHNGVGTVVAVIDAKGPRVVAYGKSGAADGRPLDGDTIFQIGSLTKVFTTLLLAEMVQRGEVGLEDPAQKYLPAGVNMPVRGRSITLLDLATHRSGLPSMPTNFRLDARPNPFEAYSVRELHQFLSTYELPREPGERGVYSNLGVSLLGRLLAQRAKMDYEELLTQRVLKPLGMNSTAVKLSTEQRKRLATGHDRYLEPIVPWDLTNLPGSGGLRSTANDMLRFLSASLGYANTPLNTALEYQRNTRSPRNRQRALAWGIINTKNGEVFGHDGGKEGYRAAIALNPTTHTGVVVLQNSRSDDRPTDLALYLLTGKPISAAPAAPPKPTAVKLTRKMLQAFEGRYRQSPDTTFTVLRRGDGLFLGEPGEGVEPMFATGPREFASNTEDLTVAFDVDSNGRVTGLTMRQRGKDMPAMRVE